MPASLQIVQSIQHDVEALEKVDVILGILDVRVVGCDVGVGGKRADDVGGSLSLALPHVMLPEEELPVEIARLNGVEINLRRAKRA